MSSLHPPGYSHPLFFPLISLMSSPLFPLFPSLIHHCHSLLFSSFSFHVYPVLFLTPLSSLYSHSQPSPLLSFRFFSWFYSSCHPHLRIDATSPPFFSLLSSIHFTFHPVPHIYITLPLIPFSFIAFSSPFLSLSSLPLPPPPPYVSSRFSLTFHPCSYPFPPHLSRVLFSSLLLQFSFNSHFLLPSSPSHLYYFRLLPRLKRVAGDGVSLRPTFLPSCSPNEPSPARRSKSARGHTILYLPKPPLLR